MSILYGAILLLRLVLDSASEIPDAAAVRMGSEKVDITANSPDEAEGDMLPEYHLDYSKARPNRFARGIAEGSLIVVLEPELARVFKTPEQVKTILRAIAGALPQQETEPSND
jgi:hypothetical protein